MYIAFPADEKAKARLDAICQSLKMVRDCLESMEFDVLVKSLIIQQNQHHGSRIKIYLEGKILSSAFGTLLHLYFGKGVMRMPKGAKR